MRGPAFAPRIHLEKPGTVEAKACNPSTGEVTESQFPGSLTYKARSGPVKDLVRKHKIGNLEEQNPPKGNIWLPHACIPMHSCTHIHTYTNTHIIFISHMYTYLLRSGRLLCIVKLTSVFPKV